jgi:hypothetical protein
MTTGQSQLLQDITQHIYNPAGIQRAVFAELARATNGDIQVVDPTNPFVFALESSSVGIAAFMMKAEALTRYQYAFSAQTEEELYPHMSDKDFVDRFATAAKVNFSLLIPVEELQQRMVLDLETGYKKMVIPRNTYFTVADTTFSIQYPVEIRQLAHGGLQVVYDVEKPSPLQALETNVIEHEVRPMQGQDWLYFELETLQFSIVSRKGSLNAAQDFVLNVPLDDLYYYTRVYVDDGDGGWTEIRTTHTEQVYDISTPTAVLKVVDNVLTVKIPQVYTATKLLNKGIRIDAYQTKGPINMILSEYPTSSFEANWVAYDKKDETIFTAPLKNMRTIRPFSDKVVSGGAKALSFEDLRTRVIENAVGAQKLPITNVQIEQALDRAGYQVVKNIDLITNRVFLATRPLPDPKDTSLLTAAAASIETVRFAIKDAVLLDSVIDNGNQITITPDTVYKNVNGITSLVPSSEVQLLASLPAERRAVAVTTNDYLYTPFHYVLDMSSGEFQARPYYLDSPLVQTKLFVAENDTTLIQVGTSTYTIQRKEGGYDVVVITKSADEWKALPDDKCYAQLAYIPFGEKARAYINGTLLGKTDKGERIYSFDLSTNFEVDKNDNLSLTKFSMFSPDMIITRAGLLTEFDLLYSTSQSMGSQWRANSVDDALGKFLLPAQVAGINHEKLRVRFGYSLQTLWARARSVISTIEYEKWDQDVPRLYEQDVLQQDAFGSTVIIDGGVPTTVVLHAKGDPVLDDLGDPVYLHRVGDVKLSPFTGLPLIANVRGMIREVDMMLIEGAYRFATDLTTATYRASLTATLVDWLTNDLTVMTGKLLDQTRLYFYPKTTLGTVQVMVSNGQVKTIAAGQALRAQLYVSATVFANLELRDRLAKTTIRVINEQLKSTTVSIDAITTALRSQYGGDVIAVKLTGLGGIEEFQAVTILNDEDRLSIRKRLTAQADGSLIAEEDVTVDFVRHQIV